MAEEDSRDMYRVKNIVLFGSLRRILLQTANGPCPLLAICNVLLLRNQFQIPPHVMYVSFSELVQMMSNLVFDVNTRVQSDTSNLGQAANLCEQLSSCLDVLPGLNVGLDVNCRFSGPKEFEFTRELEVFDLLDIGLYHGWVVSMQDERAFNAFGHLSYNQVVERLIALEEAQQFVMNTSTKETTEAQHVQQDPEDITVGDVQETETQEMTVGDEQETRTQEMIKVIEDSMPIKEFMDSFASQLSYEGLLTLHTAVRERELAVFYRNSHFSVMLKYDGKLYLLCTDIAFANSNLVWERLDEVDGDTFYCDANFIMNVASNPDTAMAISPSPAIVNAVDRTGSPVSQSQHTDTMSTSEQLDLDAQLAWQFAQDDIRTESERIGQQPATSHASATPKQQPQKKKRDRLHVLKDKACALQ